MNLSQVGTVSQTHVFNLLRTIEGYLGRVAVAIAIAIAIAIHVDYSHDAGNKYSRISDIKILYNGYCQCTNNNEIRMATTVLKH